MKGLIAYYSTTGNTALLCRSIAERLPAAGFVLHDVSKDGGFDPEAFGLVGFATFADELRAPELMEAFIASRTTAKRTCAFVLNSYGSISGRTLDDLAGAAGRAGYRVIAGASIHMPENYPPIIRMGLPFGGQPGPRQAAKLSRLIGRIEESLPAIESGGNVRELRRRRLASALPLPARFLTRAQLGEIEFDMEKCTRCMRCANGCPKRAISFSGGFSVDREACQACWKCYNLCPTNALHGTKFKRGFQYRPDAAALLGRLGGAKE
jgi:ferredoxin